MGVSPAQCFFDKGELVQPMSSQMASSFQLALAIKHDQARQTQVARRSTSPGKCNKGAEHGDFDRKLEVVGEAVPRPVQKDSQSLIRANPTGSWGVLKSLVGDSWSLHVE